MTNTLVVFSGGQDSTTCLAWALQKYDKVYALTFDYGQRHPCELKSAEEIANKTGTPLKLHKIDLFKELTTNSLINHDQKITDGDSQTPPSTFVDGRNHIFLSIAAIYAKQLGIKEIITGVCQTDYSGYPDCREEFVQSLEKTLSLAMDYDFKIHTPLMHLTKAQTVTMMQDLGQIDLLALSHTCYEGYRPACGQCPACKLRLKGFKEARIPDPLPYKKDPLN